MPIKYDGIVYYWTLEVCRKANISRSTLLRWLGKGLLTKVRRDRRGWRLFTNNDILVIIAETGKMTLEDHAANEEGDKINSDTNSRKIIQ